MEKSTLDSPFTQPPTMWQLARKPKWIGGLAVCLAIAAAFALLAQWQVGRSVEDGQIIARETETSVRLESIAKPQGPVTTAAAGQLVRVTATLQARDFVVLTGRLNNGEQAYWVVGHGVTTADAAGSSASPSLAVALGWAPTLEAARDASAKLESGIPIPFIGRYLVSESPQEDDFEAGEQNSLSVSALINQWSTAPASVYGGYLIATQAPEGLRVIESPPPSTEVVLNWLNVFYAIEWVVFAGFAVFLWYRLLRDEWVREREDAAERDLTSAGAHATSVNYGENTQGRAG
ncbi:MAG: SURF1 family cytochrome oxidase biogenesis protein [Microbacteriaceae bacterium]